MSRFAPLLAALAVAQGAPPEPAPAPAPAAAETAPAAPAPAARPPAPAGAIPGAARPAAPPRPRDPAAERAEAERAARGFLAALAAGDADRLAAAGAERFAFEGAAVAGRDAVRRAWRALLAARPAAGAPPELAGLEILTPQQAAERLGPPPARLAPLARAAAHVALGDLAGRPVVLFLGREAGRVAVLGMHD